MMSSKSKAVLLLITIFIVGAVVGIVFDNLVLDKKGPGPRHHDPNAYLFEKFTNELSLTPAQQDTLQLLLENIKEKHRALGEKQREEYKNIRQEFDMEFRKILTDDQLKRYDEMVKEFEERMKKRRDDSHREPPRDR